MKRKSIIGIISLTLLLGVGMMGCDREASVVSENISKEADKFNVPRRLVVINGRTDTIILSLTGNFSISVDNGDDQLEVVAEVSDGVYRKHFIGLSDEIQYFVEDIGENEVSKYKYEVEYMPEKIIPIKITDNE